MLEIRNLTKVYKPKKGVPVAAVDHINLKFPDKGMVFLLGKSGSGKSTLLNLLGGLDKYDEGEIIIKGVSSAKFKQSHFDSYRNTYLGFIFQEYNILEEFDVGANIALALELQGQKASDQAINAILEQVDLAGYGKRKPNELSGGQKQRVAIARALVKNPQIIMADEPTGALDSNTGRQVLDTLKKLSENKLVIVVSHDREFAEKYADRIIELSDGHVISDMEYFDTTEEYPVEEMKELPNISFGNEVVRIAPAYHLTEDDRIAINAWLDQRSGGNLVLDSGEVSEKKVAGRKCQPTDQNRIFAAISDDFHLIKSKLPMKNAFKIGANGLKYKKFRLVITILLSCIAFGLFGLADTFGCYDHAKTCTTSLQDSNITYATFEKNVKNYYGEDNKDFYWSSGGKLSDEDLAKITEGTNIKLTGVVRPDSWDDMFSTQYDTEKSFTETDYHIYACNFMGIATISQELLDDMNMKLIAGRIPDGSKNEMVVSSYLCQTFMIGGYRAPESLGDFEEIKTPEDMVGKVLRYGTTDFTITGIVDTNFDLDRYKTLIEKNPEKTNADAIIDYALYSELNYARRYSLLNMAMVGDGFIEKMLAEEPSFSTGTDSYFEIYATTTSNGETYFNPTFYGKMDAVSGDKIVWVDQPQTKLADNEYIISENALQSMFANRISKLMEEPDMTLEEAYKTVINENSYKYNLWSYSYSEIADTTEVNCKIVGYIPTEECKELFDIALVSDDNFDRLVRDDGGVYNMAIGGMPDTTSAIHKTVEFANKDIDDVKYNLANSVTFELDGLNEVFSVLSKVFLYIGIGFAVFASIMLANFISTSISHKKQEIGILRAIGARGSDVFRIFFSESFIIAMINFVLSSIGVGVVTALLNYIFRHQMGILVTILRFGVRQVALLFIISIVVAALSSFFPVNHIAKKKPIDAIRNR